MKLYIKEKEVLFTFGYPFYRNTIALLKTVATLTVALGVQTSIKRLIIKLMAEGVEKLYCCFLYNLSLEMEDYHNVECIVYLAEISNMEHEV